MIPANPQIYEIERVREEPRIQAPYQSPDNISTQSELVDWEMGGIALQDQSEGLQYQVWKGYWDEEDNTAYLQAANSTVPIAIFEEESVIEFCFTFDQNMRWAAAIRLDGDILKFRWYDSASESYVTTTYTGIKSVRLCLDDKRKLQIAQDHADIILTYILTASNRIGWRIQRDRFMTQYLHLDDVISEQYRITHFGMSKVNRLQWRLGPRRIK